MFNVFLKKFNDFEFDQKVTILLLFLGFAFVFSMFSTLLLSIFVEFLKVSKCQ